MEVIVKKLTDESLMRRACEMTMHGKESKMTLKDMYFCEHSPMRTQLFWIEMLGIPSFVSVHFRTHGTGIEHFVTSNREDRGGDEKVDRWTPVNHGMLINAQALVNLARKRLCRKAHAETQVVMHLLCARLYEIDSDLAIHLYPECVYRGGCFELKTCGWYDKNVDSINLIRKR